jgi:hypothetical protein
MHPELGRRNLVATHVLRNAMETCRAGATEPNGEDAGTSTLMRMRRIHHLVVARAGRIVTVADLLELMGRGRERPAPTCRRRPIHHRVPHKKHHGAMIAW